MLSKLKRGWSLHKEQAHKLSPALRANDSVGTKVVDGFYRRVTSKEQAHKLSPALRGQLSIFALLIFQTLFILFAMSLNVALVVHDKINLQNSVDIAAYYGAMKQAEMLNAIAHINYQIRQSWKLLTWRYRVLGSMGLTDVPSTPFVRTDPSWGQRVTPIDTDHSLPTYKAPGRIPGPYFFCVGHQYWGDFYGPDGEHSLDAKSADDLLCKEMESTIKSLSVPPFKGGLGLDKTFKGIANFTSEMNNMLKERCDIYGFNSWLLGAVSFVHFNIDQSDRKQMIYWITKALMNGKDIDNNEIKKGVKETFKKNLSFINKNSLKPNSLEQFSSLEKKEPDKLIQDQPFYVIGLYAKLTGKGGCKKQFDSIYTTEPPAADKDHQTIQDILKYVGPYGGNWPDCGSAGGCKSSAGMKKTNLMVYYGVKAELDYQNQIFLPFKLKLKAKAFAKPFGGRIGPPTGKDNLLPDIDDGSELPDITDRVGLLEVDKRYSPNYSRYPGDTLGLRSKLVHSYWTEVVRESIPSNKKLQHYVKEKGDLFLHDRDPMARNNTSTGETNIIARQWEIAAVAPDLFDVTYFTILPYYQYDYFPRLAKDGGVLGGRKNYLRGDLGTYCDNPNGTCNANNFKGTSLLSQLKEYDVEGGSQPFQRNVWSNQLHDGLSPNLPQKPVYKVSLNHLLTGWNPPIKKHQGFNEGYEKINNTKFGKCDKWVHDKDFNLMNNPQDPPNRKGKIANGCIYGGRTGYSVKMVHPESLPQDPRPDWF